MLRATVLLLAVLLTLGACGGNGKPRPIESGNIDGLHAYLAGVSSSGVTDAQLQQVVVIGTKLCGAKTSKLHSYAVELKPADENLVIHYLCPWRAQDYAAN